MLAATPALSQPGYVCQFSSGPRAGETRDLSALGGLPAAPGTACSDGQGSSGIALGPGMTPLAQPLQPPPRALSLMCRYKTGPRVGQADVFPPGAATFAEGSSCNDGRGSSGVGVQSP